VQAKGNLQTVGLSARGDRIKAGRAHGVRSPLLLAANHGARSPTISLTNSPGSARLSQWHVGFVLMHIAAMPARRGGAKLTGLIGCALPRQTTLHGCRRQRYRVLSLCRCCSNPTLENSTSFTTFLSASSIFSRFVVAVRLVLEEEGLRHQPR
jgi:hypothetical protein